MLSVPQTNIKIAVLFGCLIAAAFGFGTAAAQEEGLYKGKVVPFRLNIREKPSLVSEVVTVAEQGETLDVIEEQGGVGGWLRVTYKNETGYVRNRPQYIRLLPVQKQAELKKKEKEASEGKKEEIEARIETQEKLVESFSQKEVEIIEGLNEIDYALNRARLRVAALSSEIMQMEAGIENLRNDRVRLKAEILENESYAGKRLRALYKMNMIGRLDMAGLPSSVFDFFLQQNAMKRVTESDFELIERQNSGLEQLEILEANLKKEIQSKTELEAELNDQIKSNNKETLKREMILQEIRQKKKLSLAAVESLKIAALQLENQISSIEKGDGTRVTGLSFSNYKGRLEIPAKGEIISHYGPSTTGDYKAFTFQKGIDIKVERGEPVKSVFKGEVMFAQWLKGYGNLLIIDHGDNYYTLYAHVEEIFKQKGEKVETGEVIATAGDTGSIKGLCLHFEVRHHGKPVNPLKWLKKGA